jgi:hypothetical protein
MPGIDRQNRLIGPFSAQIQQAAAKFAPSITKSAISGKNQCEKMAV